MDYSIISPGRTDRYLGFTEEEIRELCHDFSEMKLWYGGYHIGKENSMFNPYSIMMALEKGSCECYWEDTARYEAIKSYIQDELQDDYDVNVNKFQNDFGIIRSKDDALTALIHLGYLTYNRDEQKCFVPNKEVRQNILGHCHSKHSGL